MTADPGPGPGRGRRVRRPSGDDRERAILSTAERLLGERSIGDISIDDLARGAGISRPTFYFYFSSKEAVVLALLDRVAGEARLVREEALSLVGEDPARLWRQGVTAICDTFRAHRSVMVAVGQMLVESEEVRKVWGAVIEGFVADTAAAIEAEMERGAARPGVAPRDLAVALNWMNERVFHSALTGQDPALPEDRALEVLLVVWSRAIYGDESLGGA